MKNASPSHAFTLIEILVVLIIMSVVMAVVLVMFNDFNRTREHHLMIQALKQSMQAARLEAILQATTVGLKITETGYQYYRYYGDDEGSIHWSLFPHDFLGDAQAFPANTKIQLTPKSRQSTLPDIYFFSDGSVSDFTLTITFSNQETFTLTGSLGATHFE